MKLNLLKNLGVAVFATFTLIGCASSDNGGGDNHNDGDDGTPPISSNQFEVVQKFDTSFISDGNPISVSALQNDGKILIATMSGVFRLNPDGSVDSSFNANVIPIEDFYYCESIVIQSDGKILLGYYSNEGTNQVLFRLNENGSIDHSFTPNIKGEVDTYERSVNAILPLNDGSIIIGGAFAKVDNHHYYHLAKLDQKGSLIQDFQPKISPEILNNVSRLFSLSGNRFMVTGSFFTNQYLSPLRANAIIFDYNGNLDESFNFRENLWVEFPIPALKKVLSVVTLSDGNFLFGGNLNSIMKIDPYGNKINSHEVSLGQINIMLPIENDCFLIGSKTTIPSMDAKYDMFLSVYNLSSNSLEKIPTEFDHGSIGNIIQEAPDTYLLFGEFEKEGKTRTKIIRIKK